MADREQSEQPHGGSSRKPLRSHGHLNRLPSTQIPAILRYGKDAHEDVTAPSRIGAAPAQNMNQSIFSMIAAAGSRTDFHQRFDESSDSEIEAIAEEAGELDDEPSKVPLYRSQAQHIVERGMLSTTEPKEVETKQKMFTTDVSSNLMPKLSLQENRRRALRVAQNQPKQRDDPSQVPLQSPSTDPRDAPVMSMLLTAEAAFQADEDMTITAIGEGTVPDNVDPIRPRSSSSPATLLATRLMEIFGFDEPETVTAEYPCWLLQSVLLQGYLYVTKKHICFFAYLPKKTNSTTKTGYLSKRGRNNPKYRRYWFTLKDDVLSYYLNPSDVYFPRGNIDLRYAISASISTDKSTSHDGKDFSVVTDHRTYFFCADSASNAKEWVKALQRTIFRSRNEGDSVKISLPVENIIDIEESPVVEFAETVKVRVIEDGDSYAIDEYFFSFFNSGRDALNVLGNLIDGMASTRPLPETFRVAPEYPTSTPDLLGTSARSRQNINIRSGDAQGSSAQFAVQESNMLATTLAIEPKDISSSPKQVSELGKPAYISIRSGRESEMRGTYERAFDSDQRREASHQQAADSSEQAIDQRLRGRYQDDDSNIVSFSDREEDSSVAPLSPGADVRMSASQILTRSDVFHTPKVHQMETLDSLSADQQGSEGTAPISSQRPEDEGTLDAPAMARQISSDRRAVLQAEAAESESSEKIPRNTSSPALQELMKAGAYPIARAGAFAGYIKNRSSKMSKLLATESMSYLEKVSGMWAGSHRHYGENEGIVADDQDVDPEDEQANVGHGDRFRTHFALPPTEKLQATYFGHLHRVLPLYGKIYISNRKFCFRSLIPGTRTKLVLPLKDIENVDKEKGFRFGYHGLVLVIRGHEELFFEFRSADHRDDCTVTLLHSLESVRYMAESGLLAKEEKTVADLAQAEHKMLQEAHRGPSAATKAISTDPNQSTYIQSDSSHMLFDDPRASIINFKPAASLRITCLTIGSRGDVQPYIALCKGLLAEGHRPRIATHAEFGPWVEKHGIEFISVGGDPAELMRICVENGMFTYSFLREATAKFRSWIDELLCSAWEACQGSDVLIESPSAMAGIHIAEALGIPYFRAFTMPWTRTRAYPHAFAVPEHKIGGAYNYFSYVMFDAVFWKGISAQVNRWRKRDLGLSSTNLDRMQPNKVPFLYNFSPQVVPPPLDYSDWVRVTGYWFLNETENWTPPADLAAFIKKAREDKKKLVYIGFGSIVVSDPAALTKTVVESVLKADVRCILSKGWSDRLGDPSSTKAEVVLPPDIFQIKAAPHDWLFFQVDAAVHHGGAGTTGASLRAGIPTIIKPFFGDQFFFGGRVEDLGVGILLRRINVSVLGRALWEAVHSERMIAKARMLGEKIRKENGVATAIQAIYRDLEYAQTLVRARQAMSRPMKPSAGTGTAAGDESPENELDETDETEADLEGEESWTFVDSEIDPTLRKRMEELGLGQLGEHDELKSKPVSGRGNGGSRTQGRESTPAGLRNAKRNPDSTERTTTGSGR